AAGKELRLDVEVRLDSREPIRAVQVVQNGKVIQEKSGAEWARTKALGPVVFKSSGWFLVRVLGEDAKTVLFASNGPDYVGVGWTVLRGERRGGDGDQQGLGAVLPRLDA